MLDPQVEQMYCPAQVAISFVVHERCDTGHTVLLLLVIIQLTSRMISLGALIARSAVKSSSGELSARIGPGRRMSCESSLPKQVGSEDMYEKWKDNVNSPRVHGNLPYSAVTLMK